MARVFLGLTEYEKKSILFLLYAQRIGGGATNVDREPAAKSGGEEHGHGEEMEPAQSPKYRQIVPWGVFFLKNVETRKERNDEELAVYLCRRVHGLSVRTASVGGDHRGVAFQ